MRGSAVFRTGVAPGGALAGPWVQNPLWAAARAVPSLDLRFADSKSLVDATTGASLVTFTRASSGTFVGSDGVLQTAVTDAPRFDHNPTTGESLGLLVEEQRTNGTTHSQDFGNVAIAKNNATVTDNTATTPAGDSTADKIVEDSANSEHGLTLPNFSYAASTAYVFTIFAKAVERSRLRVLLPEASFGQNKVVWFDLSNGSVIQTSGTGITAFISAYANGWYRCAISATTTIATAATAAQLRLVNSGTTVSYTGDNTSGLLLWGAQLEAGAFPTSYIPTTTAAATRSADVASITGTAFSSWYRQDEGTVFSEYRRLVNASGRIFTFNDTTANEQIRITASQSTNIRPDWQVIDGGFVQANVLGAAEIAVNSTGKSAGAYKVNDFQQATNSFLGTADTAGTLPTISVLNIGANESGSGSIINGTIRRLTYFPTRLANETLQRITQ